ncbi:MAG: multicopper oxidase domain-containing protein [Streptosporangiaceae bacterium]|nr:multicopper oxidase domain-containing protein [Streptosporangiaceae bacterium]MBV9857047.1 multicopper oxidase domain-containing protein [Streptosporangiaceae bacterium]
MTRTLDRRSLLRSGVTGAAAAVIVPSAVRITGNRAGPSARPRPAAPAGLSKFTELLAIPPVIDLRAGGSHMLTMGNGRQQFHRALGTTPTFGYAGAPYLGPILVVRRGVPVELTFVNQLGAHPVASAIDLGIGGAVRGDRTAPRASVHVHGGLTPPEYDGHPMDWFASGTAHRYLYPNDQEAATLWFHDHAMGITRLNVYAGLAGGYLIRDRWDTGEPGNGPGLPYGAYELPLIIQDKSFTRHGRDSVLAYPPRDPAVVATLPQGTPKIWVPEFFGNVGLVNGKVWPYLPVNRSIYRFHVINGSQARFWHLFFGAGGPPIWQIGTDQGLLDAAVPLPSGLLLAPGERADVLIDFTRAEPGRKWVLHNDAPAPYPDGDPTVPVIGELIRFTVTSGHGPFREIPARLRAAPLPCVRVDGVTRNVTLQEKVVADGESYGLLLNGVPFTAGDADIIHAGRGRTEKWNIINLTADAHPIHLHLVAFRILERVPFRGPADSEGVPQGLKDYVAAWHVDPASPEPILGWGTGRNHSAEPYLDHDRATPPEPGERGGKDTIICPPGQVTRIAVPFTGIRFDPDRQYVTQAGARVRGYVWHCHILEHEEYDMMQRYRVT